MPALALPAAPSALRSSPASVAPRPRTACRASASRLSEAWEQARSGSLALAAAAAVLLAASPAQAAKLGAPLVPVPVISQETAQEVVLVEEEIAALVLLVGLPLVGVLRIASATGAPADDEPTQFSVSGSRRSVEQVRDISPRRQTESLFGSLFAPGVSDKLSAPVSTVMTREVLRTFPTSSVSSALAQMGACTGLVVVSEADGSVLGIFSKRDANVAAPTDTVASHMSSPALTIVASTQIVEAAALMLKHDVHRLPVTDASGNMVGILTRTDVFQSILSKYGKGKAAEPPAAPLVVRLR